MPISAAREVKSGAGTPRERDRPSAFASLRGLRVRLLLIAMVAFVPALLLSLYAHREQRELARSAAEERALALVRQVGDAQARVVARALAEVEMLADVPVVRTGGRDACSAYVARVRAREAGIVANIARVAADGRVTCSALPTSGEVVVSSAPDVWRALAARAPFVTDYAFGPIVGHGVVAAIAPMLEPRDQEVFGFVAIAIDLRWLREVFARSNAPPDTQLTLLDRGGSVLARFPEGGVAPGTMPPESPALLDAAGRRPEGGILRLPAQPDRIYAFHYLSTNGAAGLLVHAAVPKAAIDAPADAQLGRQLVGLFVALALMLGGTLLASRYLVLRPIRRLRAAAQRLARGDLSARAGLGPAGDEVADLGQSFDRMAASLQARQTALRERQVQVEHLNRAYAMLSAINGLIIREDERDDLLTEACRIAVERGGYPMVWIGLLEPDRRCWATVQAAGSPPHGATVPEVGEPIEDSPELGSSFDVGRVTVRHTAENSPGHVALPLRRGDVSLGCMTLYTAASHLVDESEMRLLEELAADISHALVHLEQAARLDYVSATDLLTGLPNSARFQDRLAVTLQIVEREPGDVELGVMLVALKGLRDINAVHGLHVGDRLLRVAAAKIQACLPSEAQLARLRSGIFAIVLPQRAGTAVITSTVERILECFNRTLAVGELELVVGGHIGVSLWPADGHEADVLMQHAETALAGARDVPERFRFFVPQLQRRAEARLALEGPLHHALERGELYLRYQPVVAVETRRLVGVEALLRWRHPERGDIAPSEFIPVAEAAGLMIPLGQWVMNEAFEQARRWERRDIGELKVAVNVTASQLRHAGFPAMVDDAIRSSGVTPGQVALAIELTESELMDDAPHTIEVLRQLKARGIALSVDDFGTGYSSLSYLGRFPLDTLKIDIAFVRDLPQDPTSASIVEAIIAMANALGLETVAEGVETPEQFRRLAQLGCRAVQGYLFGAAMPPEAIENLTGKTLVVEGL